MDNTIRVSDHFQTIIRNFIESVPAGALVVRLVSAEEGAATVELAAVDPNGNELLRTDRVRLRHRETLTVSKLPEFMQVKVG